VIINHQNRGVTPLAITDLPAGTHLLLIEKPDHRKVFETFTLEEGSPRSLTFALEPLTGLLLMTSNPEGAEITYNGAALGLTPLLISTLAPGTHRLSLSLPGYQRKEMDVTLSGRTPVKQEVELMSASGTLNVTSDPTDADVFVNGISRGTTPCRIDRIPDGNVTIEIKADGFDSHTRQVALAAGEVQNIDVSLKPLPGTLRIVSIPAGARVYINDEYKDVTPYDFVNAPPATYRVRVEQTGYAPNARNVDLEKGDTVTEEFRLTKIMGRLEVTTAPAGSVIFLDGKRAGVTSAKDADNTAVSQPFPVEDVLEGEHQIEITRPGYATQRRDITVHRDMTLTLQFQLVRQFIPNYEVTTTRAYYTGVLEYLNEEGIRIETRPGISQTIPMKDVKKHGPLRKED
ncbi:MAG: PEGA domain-containing protein, partial [Kiritimatiellaeota bacterium]|nr:PEGA domain-containing protein [Kiritimatiellota bacterium]